MTTEDSSPIYQAFAGHLGHLTTEQEEALVLFKDNLSKVNLYQPATEGLNASHDDPTLL